MDNFIDLKDYDASLHKEILSSLVRRESAAGVPNPDYDPSIIEICEDRAVSEMESYLNKSYDTVAIFSARGEARHALILMYAIDISIYHIYSLHNPYKLSELRKERYKRATEWLQLVARGELTIGGAPRLSQEQQSANSPWQIHSERARPHRL